VSQEVSSEQSALAAMSGVHQVSQNFVDFSGKFITQDASSLRVARVTIQFFPKSLIKFSNLTV
jgi:hypothetical protein